MPGPQPQLSYKCHMDALRGGSHPLAVQVQLPPDIPWSELFCWADGFVTEVPLSYTSVPLDPDHWLHRPHSSAGLAAHGNSLPCA